MIELSFRNLMRNKTRTLLTMLGIVIGVGAIVSLVSISDGIRNNAETSLSNYQYIFLMQKGAMGNALSKMPAAAVKRVAKVRGVKDCTSVITGFASSFNGKKIGASSMLNGEKPITIVGIEPQKADEFKHSVSWYSVKEGRMLRKGEKKAMLVSENIIDDYHLYLGSWVELNGEKFKIVGVIDVPKSIGGLARVAVVDISKSREMNRYGDDEIGIINILPEHLSETKTLIKRLESVFEDEYQVFSSDSTTEMLGSFLGTISIALWLVSSIAAVVGSVGVMNTMLMSVMERIQEFGVLKAIGWKDRDVVLMIVGEALLIGLGGGIGGSLLGYLGSYLVYAVSGIPTYVPLSLIAEVMGFSIAIGVFSSLYPAFVAASMSPIEAVTYE